MAKTLKAKMGHWWRLDHFFTIYIKDGAYFFKVWLIDKDGAPHIECHRDKSYNFYDEAREACNTWLNSNKVQAKYVPTKRSMAV